MKTALLGALVVIPRGHELWRKGLRETGPLGERAIQRQNWQAMHRPQLGHSGEGWWAVKELESLENWHSVDPHEVAASSQQAPLCAVCGCCLTVG